MPIWGYPPMLASFVIDSNIIQAIIVFAFGAWWLGWAGTLFLSSTRMIFAAAFDRMLPEWAGRVSDTRAVPGHALAADHDPIDLPELAVCLQLGLLRR